MNSRTVGEIRAVALLAFLLVGAGLAWACTTQPYIQISPKQGEPGTVVEVNGNGFSTSPASRAPDSEGSVEIRWNSPGGPKLGEASGPSFSVPVTIPDDQPGVHYILAIEKTVTGSFGMETTLTPSQGNIVARDSFEVLPATARPQPQEPHSNTSPPPSNNETSRERPSPSQLAPDPGETAQPQLPGPQQPSADPAPAGAALNNTASDARPGETSAGSQGGSGPDGRGPAVGDQRPGGPPGPGGGGESALRSGAERPGGPPGFEAGGESVLRSGAEPAAGPRSLARSVSADLWSGFERATVSPSIFRAGVEEASRQRSLSIGISIAGASLIALLGGLVVLETRRRRELSGYTQWR